MLLGENPLVENAYPKARVSLYLQRSWQNRLTKGLSNGAVATVAAGRLVSVGRVGPFLGPARGRHSRLDIDIGEVDLGERVHCCGVVGNRLVARYNEEETIGGGRRGWETTRSPPTHPSLYTFPPVCPIFEPYPRP